MRRLLASFCIAALALTGCGGTTTDSGGKKAESNNQPNETKSDKPKEPKSVNVGLLIHDNDPGIRYQPGARVTNDEYMDGVMGTVTVSAETASKNPDDNRHWLSAKVKLRSGGMIGCSEPRSTIWSDFQVFEDISLPCEKEIKLSDVASVVIVP